MQNTFYTLIIIPSRIREFTAKEQFALGENGQLCGAEMFTYKQNSKETKALDVDLNSNAILHAGIVVQHQPGVSTYDSTSIVEQNGDQKLLVDLLADCCALAYRCGYKLLGICLEEIKLSIERKALGRPIK